MNSFTQLPCSTLRTLCICVLFCLANRANSQTQYLFTTANATGSVGPTQTQINMSYANTNLNNAVIALNGMQTWTVPVTGPYKISAYGAQGGGNGGLGAQIEGEFNLIAGDVLTIIVGQRGMNGTGSISNNNGGGGGGGSFVVINTNSLLIAAGGGGGGLLNAAGGDGLITTAGGSTYFNSAGDNGNGGYSGITNGDAAGGAGYSSNGHNSFNLAQSPCEGGKTFAQGFKGGQSGMNGPYFGGSGGFGGGGSGWHNSINRCGGGGGYSGGQGGTLNSSPACAGGGGGSFNAGINPLNLAGVNSGNGQVKISFMFGVGIIQTASIPCFNQSTAVLTSSISGGMLPYTYTWMPNGGNAPTASGLSAGTYTLLVMDNNSVLTSNTFTISQPAPLTISSMANKTLVCSGETVVLTGVGAHSYSWSGGIINNISFAPNVSTSYNVTGTNTLTGCSSTTSIAIIVNPIPSLSLSASANNMCLNGNNISLSGLPEGGNYSGIHLSGNIFTPATSGTFNPQYHFTDPTTGCSNSVNTNIIVDACTNTLVSEKTYNWLKLYPNPCTGVFYIDTNTEDMKEVTVNDIMGRIIYFEKTNNKNISINVSNFLSGIYYVSVKKGDTSLVTKLIKE